MPTKPRFLVVGASIAGLTVATGLLQKCNCEVIVFERSSEKENGRLPINGGGVGLHEESIEILKSLGISTEYAIRTNIQQDRDRTGRIIRKTRVPFYTAFWGDVHRCLLKGAVSAGAVVIYNKNVTSVDEREDGVSIGFSNDTARYEGDCVIGADGVLSTLRSLIFPKNEVDTDLVRHAGYYAWRGLVPLEDLPADAELEFPKGMFTIELSQKSHAAMYYLPRGLNWLIYLNSNDEATSTYHQPDKIVGRITKVATDADLEELYRTVETLYRPAIANLIKASRKPVPFTNQIFDRKLLSTFSSNRCILIGDAAHPPTPHHVRGSNMAIADGFVLAKEFAVTLNAQCNSLNNGGDVKDVFSRFESQRLKFCNDIVMLSARIGRVKQSVFCKDRQQDPFWDTTCESSEYTEMLGDRTEFTELE